MVDRPTWLGIGSAAAWWSGALAADCLFGGDRGGVVFGVAAALCGAVALFSNLIAAGAAD